MTTQAIRLRRATADDADDIHRLLLELADDSGKTGAVRSAPEDHRRHGFGTTPLFDALLADRNGETVGLALFFMSYSSWGGVPGVYLQDLVVSKAARGEGVGRRLLAATVDAARQRGANYLRLAVDRDNRAAMAFYERCGLDRVDSDVLFELKGEAFEQLGTQS